jgi:PAS domain S-box-containing protein
MILYADGGIGYISVNYFIEKDQQGRTIRTYGVNQDITMRKQAEIAFNQSEEKYRILFENAMEAILVAQDGLLTFVNHQAEKMVGYSREELTARPFTDFIHPDDRAMVIERHTRRIKGEDFEPTYSFRIINSSGEIYYCRSKCGIN